MQKVKEMLHSDHRKSGGSTSATGRQDVGAGKGGTAGEVAPETMSSSEQQALTGATGAGVTRHASTATASRTYGMTTGAPASVQESTMTTPTVQRPMSSGYGPANGATTAAATSSGQHAGATGLGTLGASESRSRSIPAIQLDGAAHTQHLPRHHHHTSRETHIEQIAPPPAHTHLLPTDATILSKEELADAKHDHKNLAAVVREEHQKHEIEEVERERVVERLFHHVQLHVQPLEEEVHAPEMHHETSIEPTQIFERHINTSDDVEMLRRLAQAEKDEYTERHAERKVIDRGEKVTTKVQHFVHHVVLPRIEKTTHEHHNALHSTQIYHTKIPIYEKVEEAPIIHQTVKHQRMLLSECCTPRLWRSFLKDGGDLKSNLTHNMKGMLHNDEASCQRIVEGPLPELIQRYHLAEAVATSTTPETARTTSGTPAAEQGKAGTTSV
ncbi:BQ2448_6780 [Microbotryum intermedium]|uniref:BQ2448_6780 protein n=1 Tax=Microbotryum intermedium TaxID=269621 RepID=A0A238FSY6_9BASI|nr:BQ2448_6780 [Microbotryum intermedium]